MDDKLSDASDLDGPPSEGPEAASSPGGERAGGPERRAHPRFGVDSLVPGSLLYRARARASNLSLTGLAIEAPERLEVGRSHLIGFQHKSGGRMEIRGRVVWCHLIDSLGAQSTKTAGYRAGIELEDVLSSRSRKMQLFLESQADMSLDQRVFGRFEPMSESEIEITTRYQFTIKTVSQSGLSIESEYLPPVNSTLHLAISLPDRVVELDARVVQIKPTQREVDDYMLHEIGLEPINWPQDFDPIGEILERACGISIARSPGYETNVFSVSSEPQTEKLPGT